MSSSTYASFLPLPYYSCLCSSSPLSPTSPLFPHLHLKLYPYICLLLSPYFYTISLTLPLLHLHYFPLSHISTCSIPLRIHLDNNLLPPLCPCINLHLLLLPLTCSLPISLLIRHELIPTLHIHLHLRPLPIPLPYLQHPHSSYIHLTYYHLRMNHRNQMFQCISVLVPVFYVSLL